MKRFTTTLSSLAVALAAFVATAQAEVKIATVNMSELSVMFYKRAETQASINKQVEAVRQEVATRQEKVRSLNEELDKLAKQFDPTLAESSQRSIREKAVAIKTEFDAAVEELKTFEQRRQVALREIIRREQSLISKELHDTVAAVAAEAGYDLVLDVSAVSPTTAYNVIPFAKPEMDISAAVLKKLNADAPADFDAEAELQRARAAAGAAPAAE